MKAVQKTDPPFRDYSIYTLVDERGRTFTLNSAQQDWEPEMKVGTIIHRDPGSYLTYQDNKVLMSMYNVYLVPIFYVANAMCILLGLSGLSLFSIFVAHKLKVKNSV